MPHNYSTTSLTIGNCSQIIIIGLLHPTRVRFASRLLSLIRYPCQAPPIGTVYHSMKREGDEMLPTPDRQKGTSQLIATHTVRSLVTRDPIAGSSEFHRHCPSSRVDGTRAAEISDGIARAPGVSVVKKVIRERTIIPRKWSYCGESNNCAIVALFIGYHCVFRRENRYASQVRVVWCTTVSVFSVQNYTDKLRTIKMITIILIRRANVSRAARMIRT